MSTLTASNGALYVSTFTPISRSVKEILLNKSEICHNEDHWEKLLILPIPIISLLMNLVLFMAGHIYRRKLRRHNYLYGCVSSTLLSNILYLVFHIWILLDNYFRNSKIYARHSGPIWIVCQAAVVSLQFVMFGNIVALLIITLDSTYFVGRSVNKKATDFARDHLGNNYAEKEKTWYRSVKRRRAAFLVAGAWIIPLCTTTAAAVSWNCVENCVNCEGREISDPCPHNPHCSRLWAPLHNDFLGVNVALWFVDVLVLIYIIISGIHSFRQVMVPNSSHNNLSQPNTIPLSNVKPTPRLIVLTISMLL
ncbi:unnamed protein product [Clavelina lepadiformis]|uniref:G-protein coupled receptors family 1 profile domain-containing protein n=1 Tax=Clavelina lepadiformis TaxID=159417 RepID=A0ABP0F001_CLALP